LTAAHHGRWASDRERRVAVLFPVTLARADETWSNEFMEQPVIQAPVVALAVAEQQS
jgi:hypothetical protein